MMNQHGDTGLGPNQSSPFNISPDADQNQRSKRQEVGYVLLEECEVLVPSNTLHLCNRNGAAERGDDEAAPTTVSSAKAPLTSRAWHAVDLRCSPHPNDDGAGEGNCSGQGHLPEDGCDLVLRPCWVSADEKPSSTSAGGNDNFSWRSAAKIRPFNGMLSEIAVRPPDAGAEVSKERRGNFEQLHSPKDDGQPAASKGRRRRSDASLLAGLATEINHQSHQCVHGGDGNIPHLRYLRMENAKIMFWDSNIDLVRKDAQSSVEDETMDGANSLNNDGCIGKFARMKASLILTFSLPMENDLCSSQHGSENNQSYKKSTASKSKGKCKMLSSSYQLIGSIIRCDWDYLNTVLEKLERKALSARNMGKVECSKGQPACTSQQRGREKDSSMRPFFPDWLNVEELYDRISGAGKHFGHDWDEQKTNETSRRLGHGEGETKSRDANAAASSGRNNSERMDSRSARPVEFLDLPEDVIATSVATYLRAGTLHALRVSNRKLHRSLRAVVPGLKLKLFRHQIRSLEWMEARERRLVTEGDVIDGHRANHQCSSSSSDHVIREGESVCGGDYHRAVTGGATVLLRPRPDNCSDGTTPGGALRFDSESGSLTASPSRDASQRPTRCARGGLLCDDPGLGKTITVISLILRTWGLGTGAVVGADRAALDDDSLFYPYWQSSFLTDYVRRPALLQIVRRLIQSDRESEWFIPPIHEHLDQCPDYFDVISTPICLQDIREKYNKSDCRDFKAFESDVKLCFSNAMAYNPPHHVVHMAAERLSEKFDEILSRFKSNQVNVAARSISRMKNDPNARSLVDLLEAKKRAELEEPLVSSSSTLLVVPNPLLQHWEDQMLLHIDFRYVLSSGDSPPIYYHTSKRKSKNSRTNVTFELKDVSDPLIFLDDGSRTLPPATELARFRIVLTSYNRFTAEWKNGSVEQEVRASKRGSETYWGEEVPEASPLLKVSWLRVIVDEGHVMGKNTNNLIQFASWLTAQRRWAMTGTPTQQIATQNGLKNLYFLANFLSHEYFNRRLGREKVWNSLISQGWKDGNLFSFFRLRHLMSYLMVRHTKQDLVEIPPPVFTVSDICLSQAETTTYNTVVSGIRTNIITTSMEGKTSGWQDSLLNPRQSKFASEALTNLRISCCGGLQILPHIENRHWSETLEMLRDIHHLDDVGVQVVNNFIHRAQTAELSSCHSCGIQLQTLFVIPCGHLVCTECIDSKTKTCPVCRQPFDVDDFQRLQPGLNFQFSLNILEEKKERERQYALKRVLADSARPGIVVDIDELGDVEVDSEQAHRPRRSHKRGESCVYSRQHLDGKCTICHEEHFDCNFMANNGQCSVCHKFAEECPPYASKSKYVIDRLLQLRNSDLVNSGGKRCNVSPMAARLFAKHGNNERGHRPLKAIIFSQFRAIYEYFGDRLIRRFGGACVADYSYAKTRAQELQKFIHHPECFVMLLSKEGSVGLDLSFVTHIFFLDSIYDKSLEAQVVARAYRMGATGPVFVDELMAKNSVEEVMIQMNANHKAAPQAPQDKKEEHAKRHLLLKSAKLIRPQKEHRIKKRKITENDRQRNHDTVDLKQKARTVGVRFEH